jgi:hypothetical protein
MPPGPALSRGSECALGVRHGGGTLTCGELDFGADPATADPGPPPGILLGGPPGQPAGGLETAEGEVVGGQPEEGVGSGACGVEAVRIGVALEPGGFGEGLTVEGTGLPVPAQLPPVGPEGAGGKGGHEGVGAAPEGTEEARGGGVPALCPEHDGGEQPFPRAATPTQGGGIGQRITPERGGPQGGFVHPSFLAAGTDKNMIGTGVLHHAAGPLPGRGLRNVVRPDFGNACPAGRGWRRSLRCHERVVHDIRRQERVVHDAEGGRGPEGRE